MSFLSKHSYSQLAGYLIHDQHSQLNREESHKLGMRSFGLYRKFANTPISDEDLKLYFYHLTDEELRILSQNVHHFSPLGGNPHDVIYNDVMKVKQKLCFDDLR